MHASNPFFKEVVDAHVEIEHWLSGRAEPDSLATLMDRFSPGFSMIPLRGMPLDRTGIDALFSKGRGMRPGLSIDIDELHEISVWPAGAVVGYRETQTDGTGDRTVRRSTVVFTCAATGRIAWLRLHETLIAP